MATTGTPIKFRWSTSMQFGSPLPEVITPYRIACVTEAAGERGDQIWNRVNLGSDRPILVSVADLLELPELVVARVNVICGCETDTSLGGGRWKLCESKATTYFTRGRSFIGRCVAHMGSMGWAERGGYADSFPLIGLPHYGRLAVDKENPGIPPGLLILEPIRLRTLYPNPGQS
jgi:hypothetical protein